MDPVPQNIPIPPEVPAPVPQVEIPVPEPVPTPAKPSNNRNKIVIGIIIAIFLILISAATAYYFFVFKNQTKNSGILPEAKVTNLQPPKYWINCDDKRQVIEEGNLLYIGCLGGVLIIDKTTGEVKDQISMANGMGDVTAESIVKKGDTLYIGTQDGISIFNLKTREAKKISVKEGLVNGANVELSEDGDNIWVTTFNGVTLFNPAKGTLTNYRTELDSQAEKVDVVNALVTDKYVYFLEVASVYSSGAVIRYDKSAGTFKTFKPDSFGKTDQYARIDFNYVGNFGGLVFVGDSNSIFEIDENGDDTWKKIESPFEFVKQDTGLSDNVILHILQNSDTKGLLLSSENKIYRYTPSTGTTERIYDFGKSYTDILFHNSGPKIWFNPPTNSGNWISFLDLNNLQVTNYTLKDRPQAFGQVVALIDDEPIIDTSAGIYKYSIDQGKFVEFLGGLSGFNGNFQQPLFQPIPGTSEVFIFRQVCGQGCEKPAFDLYNYADGTSKELILPSAISTLGSTQVPGGVIYDFFSLSWRNFANGKIGLSYSNNGIEKYIVYDINSGEWSSATKIPEGVNKFDPAMGIICNRVYTYKTNGNKFSEDGCTGQATNRSLSWKISDNKIIEVDQSTGKTKTLNPPVLEANYTPFDTVAYPGFSKLMFAHSKLWIASNRGLISYDPNIESYKLYGPSEGLLSKDITNYLVGKYLWVVTNMGGLSVIGE
jgi:hypothetical protein